MKVNITACDLIDSCYSDSSGYTWSALKLIEASKDIPTFDLPLVGINLDTCVWGNTQTVDGFIYHAKRIMNTDLKYPIILNNKGRIIDGWHRVAKAILLGRETIKAVRLEVMPDADSYVKPE